MKLLRRQFLHPAAVRERRISTDPRRTEVEVKERKDRVDDAMHATRAAVEAGILPGGGVAPLRSIKAIEKIRTANDDQKIGVDIVRKALSWPAGQIALNAGEDGSVVVGKILDKEQYNYGLDARSANTTPPRSCARRCRARRRSQACSSPPRPWWQRCRGSKRRRLPCPAEAWTSSVQELRLRCQMSMRT
jgi:hypothetical protein